MNTTLEYLTSTCIKIVETDTFTTENNTLAGGKFVDVAKVWRHSLSHRKCVTSPADKVNVSDVLSHVVCRKQIDSFAGIFEMFSIYYFHIRTIS